MCGESGFTPREAFLTREITTKTGSDEYLFRWLVDNGLSDEEAIDKIISWEARLLDYRNPETGEIDTVAVVDDLFDSGYFEGNDMAREWLYRIAEELYNEVIVDNEYTFEAERGVVVKLED